MPTEYAEVRSAIVQPTGPDGSYETTTEALAAGKFDSEDEAVAVASAHRPVDIGKEGEQVSDEEVKKVHQGRLVKPLPKAVEIVRKRISKKQVSAFAVEKPPISSEKTLKDLQLEEIFQNEDVDRSK